MNRNHKKSCKIIAVCLTMIILLLELPVLTFAQGNERRSDNSIISDPIEVDKKEDLREELYIDPDADFEDNVVLVRFKKEYSDPNIEVTADAFPTLDVAEVKNYIISKRDENFTRDVAIILEDHDKSSVISACEEIYEREDVLSVSPSYIHTVTTTAEPNDPAYTTYKAPFTQINAQSAWNLTTGSSSVKVAVVDTGVKSHNDLNANVVTGWDTANNDNICNDGPDFHGTSVAGVIGAVGNNNLNSTGVCWNISIVPIQIFSSYTSTNINNITYYTYNETSQSVFNFFSYLNTNNITIVNYSMGAYTPSHQYEWNEGFEGWEGIFVCAAGNDNNDNDITPHYPSSYNHDNIIAVAASNAAGTGFACNTDWGYSATVTDKGSNYGAESVDIVAPGTGVYVLRESNGGSTGNGTSFATPFVTGTAALLKSKYPNATNKEIIQAIEQGATPKTWTANKVKYGFLNIYNSFQVMETIMNNRRTIEDGTYVLGARNNSFQVMDISGSSTGNAASSVIYESNGSDSQKFLLEYKIGNSGENYYIIKNVNSGKYLEAASGGTTAGTIVQQNQWTGTTAQKWKIEEVSSGVYKIINKMSGLAIDYGVSRPGNNQAITLQIKSGSAPQQFSFIVPGEPVAVPDGLYYINSKGYSNKGINDINGNLELTAERTIFRVKNENGYCLISEYYGNKAIGVSSSTPGDIINVEAFVEDDTDNGQKWIIKDGGDGSAYVVSYLNGKILQGYSGGNTSAINAVLNTSYGTDAQRFYFEELDRNSAFCDVDFNGLVNIDEYCYALNEEETSGIDILTGSLYNLSDINSIDHHVAFVKGLYGIYTIKNVTTGNVLQINDNGTVSFNTPDNSERQAWEISNDSGVHYFLNIYTERYLKYTLNVDNSISITSSDDQYDTNCSDIVFKKHLNIQEGIDYIIVPKIDQGKAITLDDSLVNTDIPLIASNIDFSNNKQKFQFSFDNLYYYYKITASAYNNQLSIYTLGNPAILSTLSSYFSIIQTPDGYYKLLSTGNMALEYGNGAVYMADNSIENDDAQKFMLIPVSDVISDGTYQILINDDQTKALSVNSSMDANTPIIVAAANSADRSQLFYVYNHNGSYRFVSIYSGKIISVSNDFSSIKQSQISPNDLSQNWQIVNTSSSGSDYSIKAVSYRTGDYIRYDNSAISTVYCDYSTDQTFVLKRQSLPLTQAIGEFISYSDNTKDISISGTQAVLSSISANGRSTLRFTQDINGLWSIVERANDYVLDYSNNALVFNMSTGSCSQKWLISGMSDSTKCIVNLDNGMVLNNNNGTLTLDYYSNSQSNRFIVYVKGDIDNDGTIDTADLLHLRRYTSGIEQFTDEEQYRADVNVDGIVSMKDVLMLRQYLSGLCDLRSSGQSDADSSESYQYELNDEYMFNMSDQEFLEYLFGDVDFNKLRVVIFD